MDRKIEAQAAAGTAEGDAILVGRVAAGDRHAFEMLYRAYFPRLARFLQRMTRSVPLIEEIVNDTLLVVWQKAATFDGSCKVSTWVFAIAYRKACKALHALDEPLEASADESAGDDSGRPDWRFEEIAHAHALRVIDGPGFPTSTVLCANDRIAVGVMAAAFQRT